MIMGAACLSSEWDFTARRLGASSSVGPSPTVIFPVAYFLFWLRSSQREDGKRGFKQYEFQECINLDHKEFYKFLHQKVKNIRIDFI